MKIITRNKKAYFDYDILQKIEAGIVLEGDEVKSLRAGHGNLIGAFAHVHKGELYLVNATISPYSHAYFKNADHSTRSRKLLVHKKELNKMVGDVSKKGITIVPLKMYFSKGTVKVELGLAKHKKAHGKKQALKERDITRQTQKDLKNVYKY
jgi:SsrA-binding protein